MGEVLGCEPRAQLSLARKLSYLTTNRRMDFLSSWGRCVRVSPHDRRPRYLYSSYLYVSPSTNEITLTQDHSESCVE